MEAILSTAKTIALKCIEYVEQNAVWLGIVGLAVLLILVLFGFLGTARRSRKQIKMLKKIDKKVETLAEEAENRGTTQSAVAEDVAAMRTIAERGGMTEEQLNGLAHEETMESFFEDAKIEPCAAEPEEIEEPGEDDATEAAADSPAAAIAAAPAVTAGPADAEEMWKAIEEMRKKLETFTGQADLPEEAPQEYTSEEEVREETAPADDTPVEEPAEDTPVEEPAEEEPAVGQDEEPAPLTDLQAALLAGKEKDEEEKTGPVAKGRSGRLYTREELENQIRK